MAEVRPVHPDLTDRYACDRCGALIHDVLAHVEWHESLTDMFSLLQAMAEGGKRVPWDAVKRTIDKMAREGDSPHE